MGDCPKDGAKEFFYQDALRSDYKSSGAPRGGSRRAFCPRASGSKGPHNWRILTFGLQEML